jgi:RimJ/RimL family protein N-acetyltransferase
MIELAPFTDADIDRLIAWIPDATVLGQWAASGFTWPFTRAQMEAHMRKTGEGNGRVYKVLHDGAVVGHVELQRVDPVHQCVQIWRVLVDPAHRSKGICTTLMRATLQIAFDDLHMHRVELTVFDFNKAAIACYARVGFRTEGVRREMFSGPDGRRWSEVVMSILVREWEQCKSELW